MGATVPQIRNVFNTIEVHTLNSKGVNFVRFFYNKNWGKISLKSICRMNIEKSGIYREND